MALDHIEKCSALVGLPLARCKNSVWKLSTSGRCKNHDPVFMIWSKNQRNEAIRNRPKHIPDRITVESSRSQSR